jgi:hypothetical protein
MRRYYLIQNNLVGVTTINVHERAMLGDDVQDEDMMHGVVIYYNKIMEKDSS